MARDTGIQWCNDTVNPTSGCDGCELYQPPKEPLETISLPDLREHLKKQPCYAAQVHELRLANSFPHNYAMSFSQVRLIPGRLQKCANWPDLTGRQDPNKPWLKDLPRMIFISDMADALSEAVPFEYLRDEIILPVISWQKNRHIGMWLTKRPDRMVKFAKWLLEQGVQWPKNLWPGTSVTTQPTANKRIPYLLRMKFGAGVPVFVSYEPARALVDFDQMEDMSPSDCSANWLEYLDLIIVGGESGGRAHLHKFNVDWARSVIKQCHGQGPAVFVKQLGAAPFTWSEAEAGGVRSNRWQNMETPPRWEWHWKLNDSHGGDWSEWPADLRVREMPGATL